MKRQRTLCSDSGGPWFRPPVSPCNGVLPTFPSLCPPSYGLPMLHISTVLQNVALGSGGCMEKIKWLFSNFIGSWVCTLWLSYPWLNNFAKFLHFLLKGSFYIVDQKDNFWPEILKFSVSLCLETSTDDVFVLWSSRIGLRFHL